MKEVAVDGSRGERIAKAKEGLVEMQAALDQAERVVGAAARRHRQSIHEGSREEGS
jgi:hypothetical protein